MTRKIFFTYKKPRVFAVYLANDALTQDAIDAICLLLKNNKGILDFGLFANGKEIPPSSIITENTVDTPYEFKSIDDTANTIRPYYDNPLGNRPLVIRPGQVRPDTTLLYRSKVDTLPNLQRSIVDDYSCSNSNNE
jgi:hypothetical protein